MVTTNDLFFVQIRILLISKSANSPHSHRDVPSIVSQTSISVRNSDYPCHQNYIISTDCHVKIITASHIIVTMRISLLNLYVSETTSLNVSTVGNIITIVMYDSSLIRMP